MGPPPSPPRQTFRATTTFGAGATSVTAFTESFDFIEDRPRATSWEDYETYVRKSWTQLLAANPDEAVVQSFLEQHPCLVPGAYGHLVMASGHGPYPEALISKPNLSGTFTRIPDFMWIAGDSATITPVLVEIEAPAKRWFTKSGKPTAHFTQARHQLTEWKTWFQQPENEQVFRGTYLAHYRVQMPIKPLFVLVFGRRNEALDDENARSNRAAMQNPDEFFMTFDRLQPKEDASGYPCVRYSDRSFIAITFPPTFRLGPANAEHVSLIREREAAINACELMSPERREFLVGRLDYWDSWAARTDGSFFAAGVEHLMGE